MSAQKTPLYNCHVTLNAQMVDFAGTWLPLRYESEKEEHQAVRNAVGLFDVSHMGEFSVEGADARAFLQIILTRDIIAMKPGKALYALMLNEKAGILEDLIVYCLAEHRFMMCVNAANMAQDWQWLSAHADTFPALDLCDVSRKYAQLALQGPKAMELLSTLCVSSMPKRFCCQELKFGWFAALDLEKKKLSSEETWGSDKRSNKATPDINKYFAAHVWDRSLHEGETNG